MSELNYRDVMLVPSYSECQSRNNIDVRVVLGGRRFKSPIIPANMKTVVDAELCEELARRGYFYIMHRFDNFDSWQFVVDMNKKDLLSSISIGVNNRDVRLVSKFAKTGDHPDFITIDIAHGHSKHMADMIKQIKEILPNVFIIAGNVCTFEGARFIEKAGADAVKVGVGPGHACTTRLQTGFFRPQFSAVRHCTNSEYWECQMTTGLGHNYLQDVYEKGVGIPVIADGGIEYNGDIAKAMVAGATMVMAGHLLAAHNESPGEFYNRGDEALPTKEYYGSSSEHNGGNHTYVEGRRLLLTSRGSIWDTYNQIEESLRSSCSYGGVTEVTELNKVQWKEI